MDCTITAAHNSTSDLSGVLSVKTQPESGFCLKIWQSAQEMTFGVNLPRKCKFVKFRVKSIQNFCDLLVHCVTNWYCHGYWLIYWKLNHSEHTVNTMDYIILTLWSASSMILRDCEGSTNNVVFSPLPLGQKITTVAYGQGMTRNTRIDTLVAKLNHLLFKMMYHKTSLCRGSTNYSDERKVK